MLAVSRGHAGSETGAIHLTGLALLCPRVAEGNARERLTEARGKTRREIEALLARHFPRADVLPSITPIEPTLLEPGDSDPRTLLEQGEASRQRIEPLSASSFRVEFTAGPELREKLELARNLLSHAVPNGNLASIFGRALDELLAAELKRRMGAGEPRKTRPIKAGSRHVPLEVVRAVWERDGFQCTFVDEHGHRCAEKRFITIEHRDPFERGGGPTVENLCLLCKAHNAHRAREVFGGELIAKKQAEAKARSPVSSTLGDGS